MSKEYEGTSYMLIVKDQTAGRWSLLKKFLLLEANGKITGSYISSSWYQQKVIDLEKPIEYFLICVDATTAIGDIINDLVYRINNESYQFSTLINEFDYLYDIWHFAIPALVNSNLNSSQEKEIFPKNRTGVSLKFMIRKYIENNAPIVLVSTPCIAIDL